MIKHTTTGFMERIKIILVIVLEQLLTLGDSEDDCSYRFDTLFAMGMVMKHSTTWFI